MVAQLDKDSIRTCQRFSPKQYGLTQKPFDGEASICLCIGYLGPLLLELQ